MVLHAGGAAVNGGAEFQQRLASLFLVSMMNELDIAVNFGFPRRLYIEYVAYETASCIDDINLACQAGTKVYIQAKKDIHLSNDQKSDFYKVLTQFIQQYIEDSNIDVFLLATTYESSRKIREEVKKILDSIRLNDTDFIQNPLNKSETETYNLYRKIVQEVFETREIPFTNEVFVSFSKKVYVSVFGLEQGGSEERAILRELRTKVSNPDAVWSKLIAESLNLAARRLSINKNGLNNLLNNTAMQQRSNFSPSKRNLITNFENENYFTETVGSRINQVYYDENNKLVIEVTFRNNTTIPLNNKAIFSMEIWILQPNADRYIRFTSVEFDDPVLLSMSPDIEKDHQFKIRGLLPLDFIDCKIRITHRYI